MSITKVFETFENIDINIIRKQKPLLDLLNGIKEECPELKEIALVLTDPTKTFQFSPKSMQGLGAEADRVNNSTWVEFRDLLNKLDKREITGNLRLTVVKNFLQKCDTLHLKWYQRLLLKDLRIGIGGTIFEKIFKEVKKPREPQMARTFKDAKPEKHIIPGMWIEPKIDGFRLLSIPVDGIYLSRNMLSYADFIEHVFEPIFSQIPEIDNFVLDGELFNGSIEDTQAIRCKTLKPGMFDNIKYYLFDCLTVEEFKAGKSTVPLHERKQRLNNLLKDYNGNVLVNLQHEIYNDGDDIPTIIDKYIDMGFEGILLKNPDSTYGMGKRPWDWIKGKKFYTVDVRCVKVEPSRIMKKVKLLEDGSTIPTKIPTLGNIVITYKNVESGVGSGFTQEQRDYWIDHPDDIIGKIVEVAYQEIGKLGGLRFPVFKGVRIDKNVADDEKEEQQDGIF